MIRRLLRAIKPPTLLEWAGEDTSPRGYFRDGHGGPVTMAIRSQVLPDPAETAKLAAKRKQLLYSTGGGLHETQVQDDCTGADFDGVTYYGR